MLRGIESAANGMQSALDLNDAIANNLANLNTTGFKRTELIFKNIADTAVQNAGSDYYVNDPKNNQPASLSVGSNVDSVVIDFRQGGIQTTGNTFDVALQGEGFFSVQMENGETGYTRNGAFALQPDGSLTTLDGKPVLGENGPIKVNMDEAKKGDIIIQNNGSVQVEAQEADKLAVVDFEDKINMQYLGESMFVPKNADENPPIGSSAEIIQGAIESSNTNVIESMVNSINASRTYETLNSIVQTTSKTLEKNINQVGLIKG